MTLLDVDTKCKLKVSFWNTKQKEKKYVVKKMTHVFFNLVEVNNNAKLKSKETAFAFVWTDETNQVRLMGWSLSDTMSFELILWKWSTKIDSLSFRC